MDAMTEDTKTPFPRTVGRDGKSYPATRRPKPAAASEGSAQPENTGRNADGTFAKGNSANPAGKPKGARHHATRIAEQLFDDQAELLVGKCVAMALDGDVAAMRIAMERLCPPRRSRPVTVSMPPITTAQSLIAASAALTSAATSGEITLDEGAALSTLIGNVAKAVETAELAERLAKLEEQIAANGGSR
jgi:Family of unknown function (DUF5681)